MLQCIIYSYNYYLNTFMQWEIKHYTSFCEVYCRNKFQINRLHNSDPSCILHNRISSLTDDNFKRLLLPKKIWFAFTGSGRGHCPSCHPLVLFWCFSSLSSVIGSRRMNPPLHPVYHRAGRGPDDPRPFL